MGKEEFFINDVYWINYYMMPILFKCCICEHWADVSIYTNKQNTERYSCKHCLFDNMEEMHDLDPHSLCFVEFLDYEADLNELTTIWRN